MKGRWKVLQYGIKLHGIHKCDNLWLTCCALHNMLLDVDGLAAGWENGVQCYYEKELDSRQDLPKALKRLAKPGYKRNYNLSDVGIGNDVIKTRVVDVQVNEYNIQNKVDNPNDALTRVNSLTLKEFQRRLVTHFNICFQKKEIQWPKRNRKKPKLYH